jgi:hypothetical protein
MLVKIAQCYSQIYNYFLQLKKGHDQKVLAENTRSFSTLLQYSHKVSQLKKKQLTFENLTHYHEHDKTAIFVSNEQGIFSYGDIPKGKITGKKIQKIQTFISLLYLSPTLLSYSRCEGI